MPAVPGIEGTGSDTLTITGVEELHGTEFTVPADRIVAGTYVCACAATRGEIILDGRAVGGNGSPHESVRENGWTI